MVADSGIGRLFFLTRDGTRWLIRAYDQRTFRPVGAVEIPGVSGFPESLIRCGAASLAFRTGADQVFLVRTPLAPSETLSVQIEPDTTVDGLSVAGTITLGNEAPAGGAIVSLTTDRPDLV